jgi:hypothetical protein
MARNHYFSMGTTNEQGLMEDIIIESMQIYGQDLFYIPRTLISKDEILGEDRLSEFTSSYPIEMYFENIDNFDGQGAMLQKFGLMMEQSATLVVARRRWEQLIGNYGNTTIPTRPCEGDLIYFPLTKGLFEIKFVKHQDPFYQIGKLYVYKLQVELFQYASERLDTGIAEIDVFESLKSFSTDIAVSNFGEVTSVTVTNQGSGYLTVPTISFTSTSGTGATATAVLGTGALANKVVSINVTNGGIGYKTVPTIVITSATGTLAAATAIVTVNVDESDSFGDNNMFKTEAANLVFSESNPFGEV